MKQKLQPTFMLKTFIAIMAIFVLGITANAETQSYTINFKVSADNQNGTVASTSTDASAIVATANDANYVTGKLTAATKANYNSKYGINVATGNAKGSLGFNLSDIAKKKVSKIDIQAAPYNSSKTYTLTIELGGAGNKSATQTFSVTGGLQKYSANISNPIDVESITFSCAKGNRSYLQSITLYYEDSSDPGTETKVATPTFTPAAGTVEAGTTVSITTSTEGATIYYTTDGTTPSASSTAYSAPIAIDKAMTIKAIAVKEGLENSEIAEAAYTIAPVATPTFNPDAGAVEAGTTVSIATSTAGATIYYTTDGTTPTASSTEYTTPITVNEAMTIKAIAVKEGLENSEVATAAYTIAQAPQPGSGMAIYMNSTKSTGSLMSGTEMKTVSNVIASISRDNVSTVAGTSLQGGTKYTHESTSYNSVRIGTYASKAYPGGSLTITLKEAVKITKIEANIKSYKSTNSAAPTAKWNLKINDVEMGEVTTDFTTAVTKTFNYTNTTGTKTIQIETPSGTAPVDLDYIVIYSEPAGPAEPIMSFADAGPIAVDYSVNPEPFTNRMITDSDGNVSYSSSAETVAVVDNEGYVTVKGAGSTVITATVAATDNYKEKSISYTLNVNKATATLVFQNIAAKLKQGDTYTDVIKTNLPKDLAKTITVTCYEESVAPVEIFFDETAGTWNIKAVETGESYLMASFAGNDNWKAVASTDSEIFEVEPDLIQAQCQWSAGTVMAPINDFTAPELQNVPAALNNKILYKSSNEKAINVNENGEIIVRTPGKATITVSWSKTFDNTSLKTYEAGEVSTEIVISSLAGYYSPIPVPEISTTGAGDFPLSYSYSDNNGFWYGGYDNTNGGSLTITLTTATEGAQIYYKKTQGPGYDPDESSVNKVKARAGEDGFTLYSAPIECSGTEQGQLQFYAKTADKQSNTETFQFSIMTGIDGVDADNDSDARWFNLQGVEVKNPANGIYIRVANGKTTKVIR